MTITYHLTVVSVEKQLFSDIVKKIQISGSQGELGIYPGHTSLLTTIRPGMIKITKLNDIEEFIYLSGGILEVQPDSCIVLADIAIHGTDLDEISVLNTKHNVEEYMRKYPNGINHEKALIELAKVLAKIKVIELTKKVF